MKKPDLEKLQHFVKEYSFPTDVLVETIATCNLDCVMCPQGELTRPKGRMSFGLWKKIVDEVAEKSPGTRIWPALMGEPLLLGEMIFKMIRYAKDAGIAEIHLNSNLGAFRRDMIDPLFDSGLDHLIVGLDGAEAQTYEKIRRGGNYDKLISDILYILDEKARRKLDRPRLVLQFIVMDENQHEEQKFVDLWKSTGRRVSLKVKPRTGWADAVETWSGIRNVSQEDRHLPCTWLLRQMTIFWNGLVPQCDGDWDGKTNFGDVHEKSLEEIWQKGLKRIRDRHMRLDFSFSPCNRCEDWQAGTSYWVECGQEQPD